MAIEELPPAPALDPKASDSKAPDPKAPEASQPEAAKPGAAPEREIGGPAGPEPTRYGDWEVNGRCSDF